MDVGKLIGSGVMQESKEDVKMLRHYALSKEGYVRNLVSEDMEGQRRSSLPFH